ncbi:hypothetical protein ACVTT8_004179 [Yersinia enterocolitica]|uniref:hypothetical protein n=1 Tax=Yersinia enterocolitica TaxID=630 RepID=UPI003F45E4B5
MLTKEQLEKIVFPGPVDVGGAQSPIVTEMAIELLESRTESLSLREQLAAIKGAQEPVGFVKCDPCAEDCRWDCVDPIYLAGSVTPEGYGSDYFEVYRHPAPLKE